MKNFFFIALLFIVHNTMGQLVFEATGSVSFPLGDPFATGTVDVMTGNSVVTLDRNSLFRNLAEPMVGAGVSMRYHGFPIATGLQVHYVQYRQVIDALQVTCLSVVAFGDKYWDMGDVRPYFGGEMGLYQVKTLLNKDLHLGRFLSNTRFGLGLRGGVRYPIPDSRLDIRVGGRWGIVPDVPFFNVELGIGWDIGDL